MMQPELSLVDDKQFGLVHVGLVGDAVIKQFGVVYNNGLMREVGATLRYPYHIHTDTDIDADIDMDTL